MCLNQGNNSELYSKFSYCGVGKAGCVACDPDPANSDTK